MVGWEVKDDRLELIARIKAQDLLGEDGIAVAEVDHVGSIITSVCVKLAGDTVQDCKVWNFCVMIMLLFCLIGDVYVTGCTCPGHCKSRRNRNQPRRQGMVIGRDIYVVICYKRRCICYRLHLSRAFQESAK